MKKKILRIRDRKGMVLISTYLALSLMGTFSYFVFSKNIALYRASERTTNRILSFHLAETALDQAIVELRKDRGFPSQGYTAFSRGGYDIQVETPSPMTRPTLRRITANGHSPNNIATSYAYERRQVVAYVDFTSANINYGVFSDGEIRMDGHSGTDSFDSRNGPYGSQTPGREGDIGTNRTERNSVEITGHSRVSGDATVGPGGNPSQVIRVTEQAAIDGTRTAASTTKILESAQIPNGLVNQGNLRVSGSESVTLTGGTYWFSSIRVSGSGTVNFTGPATVYVSGDVSLSGHSLEGSQNLPANLTIKVSGSQEVSLSGHSQLHGVLFAPESKIRLSSHAQVFGAIEGKEIDATGHSKIHYDEALNSTGGNTQNKSNLLAWQEN